MMAGTSDGLQQTQQGLPRVTNLYQTESQASGPELFISLLQRPGFRLEHIVSRGQVSEPGFWYDQADDEWVLLLRGQASLEFEGSAMLALRAGDCLLIPAHRRHRVATCSPEALWLALHCPTLRTPGLPQS